MFNFIEEYKILNRLGRNFGLERKFLETNNKYNLRILEHLKKRTKPESYYGTLTALKEALNKAGFRTFNAEFDQETAQIRLTLTIY